MVKRTKVITTSLLQFDLNEKILQLEEEGGEILSVQCLNGQDGLISNYCYNWLITVRTDRGRR